uniref:Uncharacterized protein n=1 Tax=Mola mola TaxID=94237 RepID=A0A3Q3X9C2_MOLML
PDSNVSHLTVVQDALAQLMKTQYPLEELLRSSLPEGVDPYHHNYVSGYFGNEERRIGSLPSWKQSDLKNKGLLCQTAKNEQNSSIESGKWPENRCTTTLHKGPLTTE